MRVVLCVYVRRSPKTSTAGLAGTPKTGRIANVLSPTKDVFVRIRNFCIGFTASLALLVLVAKPSSAETISYTFSTNEGVTGSFALDNATPFSFESGTLMDGYGDETPWIFAASELGATSGSYGDYSFTGSTRIRVRDHLSSYLAAYDLGQTDFWCMTSFVSGPEVDGQALTFFGIYEDVRPESDMSNLFAPQSPMSSPDYYNSYFYLAKFSDGTSQSGQLATLALVPEASSLLLLGFGLAGIFATKRRGALSRRG